MNPERENAEERKRECQRMNLERENSILRDELLFSFKVKKTFVIANEPRAAS